ncbi:MAG: hypothetical protein K6E84_09295 [Lachnospiraceae bacterium]|nr:hypothetical protein [Lachnospiraceae bacterium]
MRKKSEPKTRVYRNHRRRALALVTAACVCFSYIARPESTIRVDAEETADELTYYEWVGINDIYNFLLKPENTKLRIMICWDEGGHKYISGTGFHDRWYDAVSCDSDRQVDRTETKWLTDNGRGAPFFTCKGERDKDNDYYPKVTIYQGETTGRIVTDKAGNQYTSYSEKHTDRRITADGDYLELVINKHTNVGGVQWTVEKRGTDSIGVAGVNIFQNVSGRDPVFKKKSDSISTEYETKESHRHWFYLYHGTEVKVNRYPAGIHCYSGQVTSLKKMSLLPEKSVTVVEPGAVLSINSTVLLSGKIVVDGGTLVVQDGATLMTYSRDGAVEGSGCIECKNGGAVVVMNKGRVALGRLNPSSTACSAAGQISLTEGGKLYNFGMVMCNRLIMNSSAEIENRPNSVLYAGYQFTDYGATRFYFNTDWNTNSTRFAARGTGGCLISASASGVKSMEGENLRVINKGTIYLSSGYSPGSGFAGLVKGNAVKYTQKTVTFMEQF